MCRSPSSPLPSPSLPPPSLPPSLSLVRSSLVSPPSPFASHLSALIPLSSPLSRFHSPSLPRPCPLSPPFTSLSSLPAPLPSPHPLLSLTRSLSLPKTLTLTLSPTLPSSLPRSLPDYFSVWLVPSLRPPPCLPACPRLPFALSLSPFSYPQLSSSFGPLPAQAFSESTWSDSHWAVSRHPHDPSPLLIALASIACFP